MLKPPQRPIKRLLVANRFDNRIDTEVMLTNAEVKSQPESYHPPESLASKLSGFTIQVTRSTLPQRLMLLSYPRQRRT